jgi:hypothetical protein
MYYVRRTLHAWPYFFIVVSAAGLLYIAMNAGIR